MPTNWKPLRRFTGWLRTPQPRSGARLEVDADLRRGRADLDAVRARFLGQP